MQHGAGTYISPEGKTFRATWEHGKGYLEAEIKAPPAAPRANPQAQIRRDNASSNAVNTATAAASRTKHTFESITAGLNSSEKPGSAGGALFAVSLSSSSLCTSQKRSIPKQ